MHCENMPGRARVWLQLLAEPDYVRVHGTCVGIGLEPPNGVQDRIARERTVRIKEEIGKQVVFETCEFYFFASPDNGPAIKIYLYISEAKYFLKV